jgi:transcriptional regulator GlxA family with amidase domain
VGAFTLARTGLLDGERATTHWALAGELASMFPSIKVDPGPIWIKSGNIYSSAGITSGIDLALGLIAEDLGGEFATSVAKGLVLFVRRSSGQAQFSVTLKSQENVSSRLQELQLWIADHLGESLDIEKLAMQANVSRRTLIRLFERELATTPGKYLEAARLEAAKRDLELNFEPKVVASRCGFGSEATMRRMFAKYLGITPRQYIERFSREIKESQQVVSKTERPLA